MEEVKVRFACVNAATQGRTGLPPPIVRELCYLQIRFLCELVALGCLVAHGDITSTSSHKLGRSYSAEEIIGKMDKLRPHFYPIPVTQTVIAKGKRKHHHIQAKTDSPLGNTALLELYGKTHRHLHRGSLKNLLTSQQPWDPTLNITDIIATIQKFSDLLAHHLIAISDAKFTLCMLINNDDGGKVQAVFAEARDIQSPRA
jgi:hypothetical protein